MLHIPAEDAARKAIRILNPISENLSIMRTLLTPSMLNVIVDNLKKGNAEGRLFEMAPVYLAKELPISEHPHERQTLCIGAFGPEEDFFTVKGALEARRKVGLKMNLPAASLNGLVEALPSLRRPTISHLAEEGWLAVETVIDESVVRDIIPQLKALGAEGIIEYPLNKLVY